MVYDLTRKSSTLVHQGDGIWEAPNWSRDGSYLLVELPREALSRFAAMAHPRPRPSISTRRCAPTTTTISRRRQAARDFRDLVRRRRQSQVYVANADGSNHRLVVAAAPSYFHGWSPDGEYLSFVANRDGKQYDLYRIRPPAARAAPDRPIPPMTTAPTTRRTGRWIYFNSDRAGGGWNIWRIPADGAGPNDEKAERITNDELEDWFPHPSPDGRKLLFLSFPAGTKAAQRPERCRCSCG